uniref:Uncharacterized protein n=1 Tax=Candidatus Kentrum sp. LFY TaxID=2126342 RepID=A0A450WXJ2_9GAMM|nr:MAG: hypothetical protein BECKLFY1418C_GA0070996_11025 [Candidatus Kentron sp. LFY]
MGEYEIRIKREVGNATGRIEWTGEIWHNGGCICRSDALLRADTAVKVAELVVNYLAKNGVELEDY